MKPITFILLLGTVACTAPAEKPSALVDAGDSPVARVDCASATIAATITTSGFAYSPSEVTIGVGDVVELHPSSSHNAVSSDGFFSVGFGEDACLRFDQAGAYDFLCTPHQFHGTINVE